MSWVAVGVGAASVIGGVVQGNKSSKAAREAQARQEAMQRDQLAFDKEDYEHERQFEDPLRNHLLQEVSSPDPLHWSETKSELAQQFGQAARNTEDQVQRQGMLGTGVGSALGQAQQLKQAATVSKLYQQGQISKDELAQQLLGDAHTQQAAGLVQGGYGNGMNMYGGWAQQNNADAQAGYVSAAQGAMMAMKGVMSQPGAVTDPTSATNYGVGSESGIYQPVGGGGANLNMDTLGLQPGVAQGAAPAQGIDWSTWGT